MAAPLLRVVLDTEGLGKIIRDTVYEIKDQVEEAAVFTICDNMGKAALAAHDVLNEQVYDQKNKPAHYKWNYNLRKALRVEVDPYNDGKSFARIDIWNDTESVQAFVEHTRQPVEEIPWAINTGQGYPDMKLKSDEILKWLGNTSPRPYIEYGGRRVVGLMVSKLRAKFGDNR